ncbi:MAG: PKD domain-containing protein [Actinobacteria bacterium]|nr:PKD domain-containing protein [Actinomycetota bacterium]
MVRRLSRVHREEAGMSVVEGLMAGLILAIGAFAVAQALTYGLDQTALARQRQTAEGLANEEIEVARALNFTNVGLADAGPLTKSAEESDPDYWLTADGASFDPDGSGPLPAEPLIFGQASPALIHGPTTVARGNATFQLYDYATWYDDPTIPGTENTKRVTVVVTWTWGARSQKLEISSFFTQGVITFGSSGATGSNLSPTVSCPTSTTGGLEANFTAVASDTDGTIAQVDWDFGDGNTLTNGGTQRSHTYGSAGTYTVSNTVHDDDGATASNASLVCQVTVSDPGAAGPDTQAPVGTVSINNGSTYTRDTKVTLNLSATDDVGVTEMAFSDDGSNFGSYISYSTSAIYTVPSGDGTKSVHVRFRDAAGNVSATVSDTILLDSVPPSAPTGLTVDRAPNKKSAVLQWNVVTDGDLAGYAVYRRPTTSTSFTQIACQFVYGLPNKCLDDPHDNHAVYEYYVVAIDLAGNVSADSNHVTV